MAAKLTKFEAKEKARLILGIPRANADALVAINYAWDMGYRQPGNLAEMAKKMLDTERASSGKDN